MSQLCTYFQPQTAIIINAFSEFNKTRYRYLQKDELKHVLKDNKQALQVW